MADQTDLDQVWFVVSPHNPFKDKKSLAKDSERLYMVNIAVEDNDKLRSTNVEFSLPKPSYTIDTLIHLREKYPLHDFHLIMGADNLKSFPKWKNYDLILRDYRIKVYKRPDFPIGDAANHKSFTVYEDAPQMHISASYIRKCLKEGHSVQYLVPDPVFNHLEGSSLYRK